ncbi:MAG: restriction endonuclease subunit S [Bacteroidota bacterium]
MAKEYLISDFLKRIKRPIILEDDTEYKLVTVKMNHNGVTLRETKKGFDIKSNMFLVKEGDFILSGIDARNGAFGIIPKELDGAIVTNDFWYFEIDENIILKELFLELTATNWFDEICKKGSDGTTQRIRLQKDKFFNQSVWLPEKNEQRSTLLKIQNIKLKLSKLSCENLTQKQLTKALQQSILHEAIQGKLTTEWRKQNPNVQSASESIEQSKLANERLIKGKKVKKEKQLQPNLESYPFELPKSWTWCTGHELFLPMESKRPVGEVFGYIDIASIDNKTHRLIEPRYLPVAEAPSRASRKVYGGSTLFSLVRPYLGNIAFIEDKYSECIASTGFFVCTPRDFIFPKYLYFLLISNYVVQGLNSFMKGVNSPSINTDDILNFSFPVPPIDEQQEIVEKIEVVMKKCQKLSREIETLNNYGKTLMKAMFNETFESKTEECQD